VIGLGLRVAGLTSIYLLVLTSVEPGDMLVGCILSVALVLAGGTGRSKARVGTWPSWLGHLAGALAATAREMVIGSVRVARFCLGAPASPGFVEIPRGDRSLGGVALWGLLTGEAPDEYPVAFDEGRDVLLVHVLDARDPANVRERHARARDRWQRKVVP